MYHPLSASKVPDSDLVERTPLFQGLTASELDACRQHLRCRTFPANATVMTAEQPGEVVFVILSGCVKITTSLADGSEVMLAILSADETVGEMSLTDNLGRSANVVTMEESTLAWMDRATFVEFLQSQPGLARNLARILSGRLRSANAQIQALATQDVHGRIARQLLSLAEQYGKPQANGEVLIPLRLTQGDLASLVGASRVRVNQALVLYKERGYISVDQSHRITVRDQDALIRRCA